MIHLWPVSRLMPKRRHSAATFAPSATARTTNSHRCSMIDDSCHGMSDLIPRSNTVGQMCQPCPRTGVRDVPGLYRRLASPPAMHRTRLRRASMTILGEIKARPSILRNQIWQVGQDLHLRHARSEVVKHVRHRDPKAPNARLSAALSRQDRDELGTVHQTSKSSSIRAIKPYSHPAIYAAKISRAAARSFRSIISVTV